MLRFIAARAGSTLTYGLQLRFHPRRDVKQTRAQRAEQTLVTRRGEQVTAKLVDVEREMPERLRCVDEKEDFLLGGNFADFDERLNSAGDIRSVRERDEPRLRLNRAANFSGVDHTFRITTNKGASDLLRFAQCMQWPQHAVVFTHTADDMIAGAQHTVQREVQGIGAVEREDNLLW